MSEYFLVEVNLLLSSKQITELSRSEKDPRKRIRLLAIAHFVDGHNRSQIASMLKVARRSVNTWVSRYLSEGINGLSHRKAKGKESHLSSQQKKTLSEYIKNKSMSTDGGRLTGTDIHEYIEQTFGVTYHANAIYKLLKSLGFSWITSRSRHPKQSKEAQEHFKKTSN